MKKSIQTEIEKAVDYWDVNKMIDLLNDLVEIYRLYDVEENDDWVKHKVGELDERNVRLIRTVYLVSKLAENHAGSLLSFRTKFPKLWKRIEDNNESS